MDTKPESDIEILKLLLECILLLCQTRQSRSDLRIKKVYCICRNLDDYLENDEISEIIYEIVNLLMRDEEQT